jgi:hypothetical protein
VNASTRALWLALMVFFALVVGLVAGLMAWAGGDNPFAAMRGGGTAFGGTVLVLFAIFYFATHGPKP